MDFDTLTGYDRAKWHSLAEAAKPETRLFIDGAYVDAKAGGRFATINPANGEVIAEMSEGTAEDIDIAVQAAKRAYRSGVWAKMAPRERMAVLYRFSEVLEEHAAALAVLETLDMGKPISDVIGIDLPAVCETFWWFAECIDKVEGAVTATEADVLHYI
ncbi:MAG: aldehyde dehydrogenase family protein, partial [Rhodovibrionaceae bacterium]